MGLRLKEGIDLNRFAALSGAPLSDEKLAHLSDIGMIDVKQERLTVTNQGFMVLNAVIEGLLPD